MRIRHQHEQQSQFVDSLCRANYNAVVMGLATHGQPLTPLRWRAQDLAIGWRHLIVRDRLEERGEAGAQHGQPSARPLARSGDWTQAAAWALRKTKEMSP